MGTKHGYSDDDLELLTEDEREGLLAEVEGDEPEDEETGAEETAAEKAEEEAKARAPEKADEEEEGDDGDDGEEDKGDDTPDDDADDKEEPKGKPEDGEKDAAEKGAEEKAPEAKAKPRAGGPLPDYEAPADVDKKIKELRQQRTALAQQFDDGEITATEYTAKTDELQDNIDDLKDAKNRASLSSDARKHHWWNNIVPDWMERPEHAVYGNDENMQYLLDSQLRQLQEAAAEKGDDPLNPKLLDTAHKTIVERYPAIFASSEPPPKKEDKDLPERENIPPKMGDVPAADGATDLTDDGRFAHLDRLADKDPLKYEAELAKMSETDREAYLAAG